jgi:predicted kinase
LTIGAEALVVWINGAFGVGKTAVADELVRLLPDAVLFDPEELGVVLRAVLPVVEQTDDFQDIAAWRATTLAAVVSLARSRPGVVVVPMTVVDGAYFDEIVGGVRRSGVGVVHVALVAPAKVIEERLRARSHMEGWAHDRIDRCVAALAGAQFAEHLDASVATALQLAHQIRVRVAEGRTGAAL